MSLAIKLGVGALTLGSIGVMSYAALPYLQQQQGTEISKLIDEEFQYKLLDTTEGDQDKEYWDTNWKNYRDDNSGKDEDLFRLEGWNKDNPGYSYSALKKKCKELSTTKVSDDKDITYSNVTKYCGRRVTLKDEAEKEGVIILDTAGENHKGIWDSRYTRMDNTKNHLDRLNIEHPISGEEIKNGCDKAKEMNKQAKDYASIYASYKLICTKQEGEKTEL